MTTLITAHAFYASTLSRRAVFVHMNTVDVKWSRVHVGIGMETVFSKIDIPFSSAVATTAAATAPVDSKFGTAATSV